METAETTAAQIYASEVGCLNVTTHVTVSRPEKAGWAGGSGWQIGTWYEVEGRDCMISLEPRPFYCDRGNWIARLDARGELAREIDEADGWPRYYFDRDRAFEEIGAWLEKRGQLPRAER